MPTIVLPEVAPLYAALNAQFFDNSLPPCEIRWSHRLTRTAGHIRVQARVITLSSPLLIDAFENGEKFLVCGVECADTQAVLREILKHEMIHLWLYEQGVPCGHTAQFRAKAREIGQAQTRHGIGLPAAKRGWIYRCSCCDVELVRRRQLSRVAACAACCKAHNGGKFDTRFVLRGRQAG